MLLIIVKYNNQQKTEVGLLLFTMQQAFFKLFGRLGCFSKYM